MDSLAALSSRSVWVPSPRDFNDPFDSPAVFFTMVREGYVPSPKTLDGLIEAPIGGGRRRPNLRFRGDLDQLYREAEREGTWGNRLVLVSESLSKTKMAVISRMGVYSLTKNKTDILMWSHYADEHRGYCLEYETYGEAGAESESIVKVDYEKKTFDPLDATVDDATLRRHVARFKAKQWSYEAEYRLIYKRGRREYEEPYRLSAVIFGMHAKREHCVMLRKIVADRSGLKFYRMASSGVFRLELIPDDEAPSSRTRG